MSGGRGTHKHPPKYCIEMQYKHPEAERQRVTSIARTFMHLVSIVGAPTTFFAAVFPDVDQGVSRFVVRL